MDCLDAETDTVQLGRLAGDLGFLLRLAQVKVYERYFRELGEQRVNPGEFSVLWAIALNPGIRQSALCQRLIIKRSHMAKLAKSLEERGLVTRSVPDDDRRGVELTVTSKGQTLVDDIADWFFAFEDRLGSGLTAAERGRLVQLLLKFITTENGAA
jgi:Transcriptional regulators